MIRGGQYVSLSRIAFVFEQKEQNVMYYQSLAMDYVYLIRPINLKI